jgi:hypothetical protein
MPTRIPNIHSELTKKPRGKRKIIVTLPNRNMTSLDVSKRDKPKQAAIPKTGQGSITRSEPKSAQLGKVTGASLSGIPGDNE